MPIGPRITVHAYEPEKFIRLYGICGIVLAILFPGLWVAMLADGTIALDAWWTHLLVIPYAFFFSWCIVHTTWSLDGDVQRKENRQFLKYYWIAHPWAISAVAFYALFLSLNS